MQLLAVQEPLNRHLNEAQHGRRRSGQFLPPVSVFGYRTRTRTGGKLSGCNADDAVLSLLFDTSYLVNLDPFRWGELLYALSRSWRCRRNNPYPVFSSILGRHCVGKIDYH